MRHPLVHLTLVFVVALWGLMFVAVHETLPSFGVIELVTVRFAMVGVCFLAIFAAHRGSRPRLSRSDLRLAVVLGVLAVPCSQLPMVFAQERLAPPLVALIQATAPAWAAILSSLVLRERFHPVQVVGLAVALAGVAVVVTWGRGDNAGLDIGSPWAVLVMLISPVSWAAYTVFAKGMAGRQPPLAGVGVALTAGSVLMLPVAPDVWSGLGDVPGSRWAWLVYMTVGGTLVPYLLWFRALKVLPASRTAVYMYGVPIFALLWSWLWLDIVPRPAALLGGAVVVAGVALAQLGGAVLPARRDPAELPLEAV